MKSLLVVLALASSFSAFAADDLDQNADCIVKKGDITCSSSGYWEGSNRTDCQQTVRYKMPDGRLKTAKLYSSSSNTTNTGDFVLLTLGLSNVLANQINAARAISEARSDIKEQTSIFYMCKDGVDSSREGAGNNNKGNGDLGLYGN